MDSGQSGADKTHQNTDRKVKAKPQTEGRSKDQIKWLVGLWGSPLGWGYNFFNASILGENSIVQEKGNHGNAKRKF